MAARPRPAAAIGTPALARRQSESLVTPLAVPPVNLDVPRRAAPPGGPARRRPTGAAAAHGRARPRGPSPRAGRALISLIHELIQVHGFVDMP